MNRQKSPDYNSALDDQGLQGCPWVWGNQTKLYENLYAQARLTNANLGMGINPSNNSLEQANPGSGYKPGFPATTYTTNPDSNINFRAISLRSSQPNPFYLFTIIQNNVLKCGSPLVAIQDASVEAGYYPACF